MLVSVCIPMYNESLICGSCSSALFDLKNKFSAFGIDTEIIFADDGSTDSTAEILKDFIEKHGYENQFVVGYADNKGKGGALKEAVKNSHGDIVVYTDADLAYGTDYVIDAVKAIQSGADMVVGSRRLEKNGYGEYTFFRRFASKCYLFLLKIFTGFSLSDSQCGLKALRGDKAREIFAALETNGFSFDLEVIMRADKAGLKIAEIPVQIINKRDGGSKVHVLHDAVNMLGDVHRIKKLLKNLPN